jgi:hypothetical protein
MGNMSIQTRDVVCINRNILALTGASHKGTTSAVLCQLGGDSLVKMGNSPSVNWLAFAMLFSYASIFSAQFGFWRSTFSLGSLSIPARIRVKRDIGCDSVSRINVDRRHTTVSAVLSS